MFGASLGSGISGYLPLHGAVFVVAWTIVRWAVTVVALSVLLSCFYYFGPNRKSPKWQWVSAGGLIGTARSAAPGRSSRGESCLPVRARRAWDSL